MEENEALGNDLKYKKYLARQIKEGTLPRYGLAKEMRPMNLPGSPEIERPESRGIKKYFMKNDTKEIIPHKGGLSLRLVSTVSVLTKKA